jgi:hypothetical protein
MSILNSEKTVLIIDNNTAIKVVFVDKKGNYIEDGRCFATDEQLAEILNVFAACYKSGVLPLKGDRLDFGDYVADVVKRSLEIGEENQLYIVYELT